MMEYTDDLCEDLYRVAEILRGRRVEIAERGCGAELEIARTALSKLYVALYGPDDARKLN